MNSWPPITASVTTGISFSGRQCRNAALVSIFLWHAAFSGCAFLPRPTAVETEMPVQQWGQQAYARFVEQNMKMLNEIYSTEYIPYPFVVDTVQGSLLIQRLLDHRAVMPVVDVLKAAGPSGEQLFWSLYEFVVREFEYVADAAFWPTVTETLERKGGDCKGLSLLLMSLFRAAGYEAYAAISNGHMWVCGYDGTEWHTVEVDKDPERNRIYKIEGFYENPLFKVYPDRTLKRKKINIDKGG